MTGYTVNTGSTTKFSQSWDRIFGSAATKAKGTKKAAAAPVQPPEAAPKASAAKKAVKKAASKSAAEPSGSKTSAPKTVRSKQAAQTGLTSGKR